MIFFNVPLFLTLFRMIIVPFFVMVFYLPIHWSPILCTIIFLVAAITDWFDGFLARRWKQTTQLGKFLDPVADKILVITALILISNHFHVWWITLPISSIIIREIVISALREWAARINHKHDIPVSWTGKIKTFIQMLSLTALLLRFNEWVITIGIITLYIAVLLTLWSMCGYLYIACCTLFEKKV